MFFSYEYIQYLFGHHFYIRDQIFYEDSFFVLGIVHYNLNFFVL